ncbi:hypothetical protein EOA27_21340 [Mesorhizobium sp. M2A.F.Ca.ET.037.01.1.1]|uniref:hypothetical protein n=2 Tax=Mesorhizobium TaxID=68287 RepID=UPI000F761F4A|nr:MULTISPECIES: hypothetical protein [unclassified Mesorhizobium]RUY00811.1 hypothetical protein EOA25_23840 [Mesorhizobium sp. M2A.F.Ca.ET.040.01.1.1]AZO37067.1 hypothetical protein EJ072_23560 [Mesorhizobium sp. M2A.F.Ca.ET.046.03.2.1]RUX11550.1 hypothetical protein EOA27_21340 [Mesorhizobium sp. M2A.F.Ca.ET.037.01.1.1]RWA92073.1 MAG: hypothetical protein EOQ31_06830 [Mesorhizobium sp.]RWB43122.1 MAG: hypothetical protein EOQ44_19130 [Mesorhizobium sp.]
MAIKETELQYTERMLRDMLAEAEAAERAEADAARSANDKVANAKTQKTAALLNRADRQHPPRKSAAGSADVAQASRDSVLDGLFPRTEWPEPPKAQFPRLADRSADRRSDFVIAALGITLGLICALFPWYIFFNQEQFGVQTIKFGGSGSNSGREGGGVVAQRSGPLTAKDVPNPDIDLFATGTVQDDPAPPPADQPFPAAASEFKMVHVANGRAMIEDDTGLWVVQRGSVLPDSSRVASIEQRGGKWVIVTSTDKVIQLSK